MIIDKNIPLSEYPENKKFFVKKWQQNDFYPIDMFEIKDSKVYRYIGRWKIINGERIDYFNVNRPLIYEIDNFDYTIRNKAYIITDTEMKDERNYNDK